jgi:hypothetical protein
MYVHEFLLFTYFRLLKMVFLFALAVWAIFIEGTLAIKVPMLKKSFIYINPFLTNSKLRSG